MTDERVMIESTPAREAVMRLVLGNERHPQPDVLAGYVEIAQLTMARTALNDAVAGTRDLDGLLNRMSIILNAIDSRLHELEGQ